MPPVRIKFVVSFSSQDSRHTVENLVKGSGSWLSHTSDRSGRLQADLQLECATTISFIDLGNSGSVMISVEVGRSSWPSSQSLVTLLPTVALMTPAEWRAGKNATTVRMFKQEDFNSEAAKEKWDRVRIICTQPFRKDAQFGLSLLRLHTNSEASFSLDTPLKSITKDPVTEVLHTISKKDELLSKMNLPAVKKTTMSQSLGWLENKVLTAGEESAAGPSANPFTSPVSRAARLVVMAAKPTSKTEAESQKAALECEALDFLISRNLTLAEINTLKVSAVRQEFEKKRQKELSHEERLIFKDISLDYAKERLHRLEMQQEKAASKGFDKNISPANNKGIKSPSQQNFRNFNRKTVSASSESPSTPSSRETYLSKIVKNTDGEQPSQSKYTFKQLNSSKKPVSSPRPIKSPRNVSKERQKLRQEDNLESSNVSGASRNNVALLDSRTTTPKRPRKGRQKNGLPEAKENHQPSIDGWFTPKPKRKKEEHSPYSYSSFGITPSSSDEEDVQCIDNAGRNKSSTLVSKSSESGGFLTDPTPCVVSKAQSNGGYSLGSNPVDKYGIRHNRNTPASSESSPSGSQQVECPLCSGLFESSHIQSHAASCGITVSSGSESDSDDSTTENNSPLRPRKQENIEECPICGDFVSCSSIETHASACAASAFG